MIIKNNVNVYYNHIYIYKKNKQKGEVQMLTCIFMVAILKDLYCILMASCPRRCRLQAILKQRGLAFRKAGGEHSLCFLAQEFFRPTTRISGSYGVGC